MMRIVLKRVFHSDSIKYDRDGGRVREALSMGNCSINIWDGSELELALCKKSSSILEITSKHFYYLVFQIHRFLRWVMF